LKPIKLLRAIAAHIRRVLPFRLYDNYTDEDKDGYYNSGQWARDRARRNTDADQS
jgi:hypothetical protein